MIKLRVISFDNKPVAHATYAVFAETGGTIGRGKDNHLVLPDPKNFISRTQAFVRSHEHRHSITNLSQATPLLLNGTEIEYKEERLIQPNDTLQIGLCRLFVEAVSAETTTTSAAVARNDIDRPAARDPAIAAEVKTESSGIASHPLVLNHDASLNQSMQVLHDEVEAVPAALGARLNNASAANDESADDGSLVKAFLRGVGIPDNSVAIELNADFMEMIGKMLSVSIQGAVDQTKLRALVKREVNADVTMVVVRGNNPIKFLDDGATVLTQMLRKKMPGFMAPVEALEDAYEDLYVHQLAVVAGMRAMVADMLKKLDPQRDGDDVAPSLLNTFLSSSRKTKHLESLAARYREVCKEYRGEGAPLFGRAFLDAYESEVRQVTGGTADVA